MLKTLHKPLLILLLLVLSCSQIAHAQSRMYKHDSSMPFVQMMLSMMVAMGLIDRFPGNASYGNFAQSDLSNPYMRALTIQGLPPGANHSALAHNPFAGSPWMQTPWSSPAQGNTNVNSASPVWGTPSWGVLPVDRNAVNNHARYGSSTWSESDLAGWVNEDWETSRWNPDAALKEDLPASTTPSGMMQPEAPVAPSVEEKLNQQPNRHQQARVRATPGQQMTKPATKSASPLSKLLQAPAREQAATMASQQKNISPSHNKARQSRQQQPCVTEFCGLKAPNLNGLWVAENGEMMGVKNKRYLWSDGKARHLTGQLLIQNEYLLASVDGHERIMRFKYKLAGNHLLTMKPDGTIREFVRIPTKQNFAQRQY